MVWSSSPWYIRKTHLQHNLHHSSQYSALTLFISKMQVQTVSKVCCSRPSRRMTGGYSYTPVGKYVDFGGLKTYKYFNATEFTSHLTRTQMLPTPEQPSVAFSSSTTSSASSSRPSAALIFSLQASLLS